MDDAKFWSRLQALVDDHGSEGAFHKLCNLYVAAAPAQRDQLRALVNLADHTWSIPMDSTLVDGTVHEFPPEQRIRANLIFHSIENARHDFWAYAEHAGMSCEKMAHSLENFLKRAERERNSRIFDRLRASRRVHPLPDLGSGFGLFQEALDLRRIDSPRPTKIHDDPGVLAKGEK